MVNGSNADAASHVMLLSVWTIVELLGPKSQEPLV